MRKRLERWWRWQKYSNNSLHHKVCVLLGLSHSPTFEFQLIEVECNDIFKEMERAARHTNL